MPAQSPRIGTRLEKVLRDIGERLRRRRKELGISATTTAEAAGMSRVTLHRIERGEPSVSMGAYISVVFALGLELELMDSQYHKKASDSLLSSLPQQIRLADYPQLKRLAWQLKGTKKVSREEALDIYERNWRHVDIKAMDAREREFLKVLLAAFGRERLLV
ncbi:MAG: helix-turn-helix transcriptional regulator [Bdellovibrionaceae bacterium]|nr:helix-turn-helix transcriptional regulator [Pseudobdellovibrionaceae bacterium]